MKCTSQLLFIEHLKNLMYHFSGELKIVVAFVQRTTRRYKYVWEGGTAQLYTPVIMPLASEVALPLPL